MNKFPKWLQWRYAVLVSLAIGSVVYWLYCIGQPYSVFRAVPAQMAVVLDFQGFLRAAMPDTAAGAKLTLPEISIFQSVKKDAGTALRLLENQPVVRAAFQQGEMAAAFSFQPADSLHGVYMLDLGQTADAAQIISGVSNAKRVFPSTFKNHTIFSVYLADGTKIVLATSRNLLIFSRFSYLVEDALVQSESRDSWWTKKTFSRDTNDETTPSLRMVIRADVLAGRLRGHTTGPWSQLPDWLAGKIEWCSLDRSDNGQWRASVGLQENLPAGGRNWDNRRALFSILPDNTALLARTGFKSAEQLSGIFPAREKADDFNNYIKPWLGKEAVYFIIEPNTPGMADDQFVALDVADSILARLKLHQFGAAHGLLKQYDYQTFEVSQFFNRSLLAPIVGENSAGFQNPVCAILGNYVVFASTCPAIELLIDKYIVSQTLGNMAEFLALAQNPALQSDIFVAFNFEYLPLFVKNIFGAELYPGGEQDIARVRQTGLAVLNFNSDDDKTYRAEVARQPVGTKNSGASILWKATLGGQAIGAPSLVYPADTSAGLAIFIQDDQHHLYRFSEGGSLVWRKQLTEQALSPVFGIDFYKNGQLYFLFNTSDAIWLVDDEGHEVDGFPLKLQSPASNGLLVVDFFNTRNYSFFISCKNGNIYGFDQYGRPLSGWNPRTGAGDLSFPLIHFKWQDKDYIAALSRDGLLSVFNRNGAPHFAPVRLEGNFTASPLQFDEHADPPRIVFMNTSGRMFSCNLRGQASDLLSMGNSKELPFFALQDVEGDHKGRLTVLKGQDMKVFSYEGATLKTRFQHRFPAPQDTLFAADHGSKLGSLSRQKRRIYLIGPNGEPHPAFPLAGTTPFVLAKARHFILFTGNGEALYAYKVNELSD